MAEDSTVTPWLELVSPAHLAPTALVLLGIWLNAADGLVTVTLMPSVIRGLGGVAYYGWAVAAFLTASILAGASAGQVSRRLGLRRATVTAAMIYVGGCIVSAAAGDMPLFLTGRALQGLGSGWIVGFCYVAIESLFAERLWTRLFALAAAAWGIASLVGPLIGGLFANGQAWRYAFWVFAAQGVVFAGAAFQLLKGRAGGEASRPFAWRTLGGVFAAIFLIGAADIAEDPRLALVLLLTGGAVFLGALWVNGQPRERLAPLAAGRPWTRAGAGYAMVFLMEVGTVALNVYEAAILQSAYGLTPMNAGYVVCTLAMGWTAAAFMVSAAPMRSHAGLIRMGVLLILAGYVLLCVSIGRLALGWTIVAGVITGAGFGASWSLATQRTLAALPEEERGIGAGAIPTSQLIGGAVGATLAGALGNLLGLTRHFTPAAAERIGPMLFAAFLPFIGVGVMSGFRLAGRQGSLP